MFVCLCGVFFRAPIGVEGECVEVNMSNFKDY